MDVTNLVSAGPGPLRHLEGATLHEAWRRMDLQMRGSPRDAWTGKAGPDCISIGGTGEARRKQYQRGLDSIARLLGINNDVGV